MKRNVLSPGRSAHGMAYSSCHSAPCFCFHLGNKTRRFRNGFLHPFHSCGFPRCLGARPSPSLLSLPLPSQGSGCCLRWTGEPSPWRGRSGWTVCHGRDLDPHAPSTASSSAFSRVPQRKSGGQPLGEGRLLRAQLSPAQLQRLRPGCPSGPHGGEGSLRRLCQLPPSRWVARGNGTCAGEGPRALTTSQGHSASLHVPFVQRKSFLAYGRAEQAPRDNSYPKMVRAGPDARGTELALGSGGCPWTF